MNDCLDSAKSYTYDEVLSASKKYFNGNDLPTKVFVDKYALRDLDGNYFELTPDGMHDRLAREFTKIDVKYGQNYDERYKVYRDALNKFSRIVPQGSPMSAIGNLYQRMSASNCVVVESPHDSIEGIMDTAKDLAQLFKRRCGAGIDLSTLRPEGTSVNNAARTTSGAWSFADFYSYITRLIGQNNRRGACILTLSVHHPDVLKFTTMKHDLTKVTGANVSLRLTNEFLQAVKNNKEYELRWPVDSKKPKISYMIDANKVWNVIVESATKTAEPGIIMWDNIVDNLPAHCYEQFKTISVNPCSEISLSAFDSCRLISINLTGYVYNAFEDNVLFDFDSFKSDVALAQQMADNLVDIELSLVDRILEVCDKSEKELWQKLKKAGVDGRRTGLGTHGLADCLAQLRIRYDSDQAVKMVDQIYRCFRDQAYYTSVELAKSRGPFPLYNFDTEKDCLFIKRLPQYILDEMKKYGRRNVSLLTQAPTGSVSILSKVGEFERYNVSSGVEPVFRNFYTRRKKISEMNDGTKVDYIDKMGDSWQEFTVFHSNVSNYLDKCCSSYKELNLPDYFVTSDKIDFKKRINLQAQEQFYLDHSISGTLNLPKNTISQTVGELYLLAWEKGLKGVTVYVDGSRDGVFVTDGKGEIRPTKIIRSEAPKRPKELPAEVHHAVVLGTKWTVIVGLFHNQPYELFMGKADKLNILNKYKNVKIIKVKKGIYNLLDLVNNILIKDIVKTADNDEGAWTTRMMSMSLRHGVPIEYLVEQLLKDGSIVDINMVLGRLLRKYITNKNKNNKICPQCGSDNLIYEDGCVRCGSGNCSWSGCT